MDLGREDILEKEMATHSSILDWEMPWTEEPADPRIEPTFSASQALKDTST